MTHSLASEIQRLMLVDKPKPLNFKTTFTKSLYQYPDGYKENSPLYQHAPKVFLTTKPGELRGTHTKKGGHSCSICLDNKPAKSAYWCRVCAGVVCATCYRGCKSGGNSTYSPRGAIMNQKSGWGEQPKCPSCRAIGCFGTQGVIATRLIPFGPNSIYSQTPKYCFGPNPMKDEDLQQAVREYIKEYNKIQALLNTRLDKEIELAVTNEQAISTDEEYQNIVCEINEQETVISDLKKMIRETEMKIFNLKEDKKARSRKVQQPPNVDIYDYLLSEGVKTKPPVGPLNSTLVMSQTKDINIWMRKLQYDEGIKRFMDTANEDIVTDDTYLHNRCRFSTLTPAGSRWFVTLEDWKKVVADRWTQLLAGCAIPNTKRKMDDMDDSEVMEQMRQLQAIMDKRGATKA